MRNESLNVEIIIFREFHTCVPLTLARRRQSFAQSVAVYS